jgi:hypothetical protein
MSDDRELIDDFPINELVRQFPDRAFRWALELPENVRGLLKLADLPFLDQLDLSALRRMKFSTIHDDLREEIPDVLHEVPLRMAPDRTVGVCILAEHSSTRMLDARVDLVKGMTNVWREQDLEWEQRRTPQPDRERKLVVGGVLYTGDAPWEEPPQLAEQLGLPADIGEYAPSFKMFFVDPDALPEEALDMPDEPFAWLLKLFRVAKAPRHVFLPTFRELLTRLSHLSHTLQRQQRRLAWIADLMAWHRRPQEERPEVSAIINELVPKFLPPQEVTVVSQTIADYYVQQGREEGRQEFLLTQLEHRFGVLPPPARQKLLAIRDPASLRDLTIRLLDAKSLEELGFN